MKKGTGDVIPPFSHRKKYELFSSLLFSKSTTWTLDWFGHAVTPPLSSDNRRTSTKKGVDSLVQKPICCPSIPWTVSKIEKKPGIPLESLLLPKNNVLPLCYEKSSVENRNTQCLKIAKFAYLFSIKSLNVKTQNRRKNRENSISFLAKLCTSIWRFFSKIFFFKRFTSKSFWDDFHRVEPNLLLDIVRTFSLAMRLFYEILGFSTCLAFLTRLLLRWIELVSLGSLSRSLARAHVFAANLTPLGFSHLSSSSSKERKDNWCIQDPISTPYYSSKCCRSWGCWLDSFPSFFYSLWWCCHSTIHLYKYAFHHFYSVESPSLKRSYRLMNRFSFLKGTDFDIAVERRVVVHSWKKKSTLDTMFENHPKYLTLQPPPKIFIIPTLIGENSNIT